MTRQSDAHQKQVDAQQNYLKSTIVPMLNKEISANPNQLAQMKKVQAEQQYWQDQSLKSMATANVGYNNAMLAKNSGLRAPNIPTKPRPQVLLNSIVEPQVQNSPYFMKNANSKASALVNNAQTSARIKQSASNAHLPRIGSVFNVEAAPANVVTNTKNSLLPAMNYQPIANKYDNFEPRRIGPQFM